MAGIRVTITSNSTIVDDSLQHAFNTLANPELMLKDIGEYLVISTKDNFDKEKTPDGDDWTALSPNYLKYKKPNPGKILQRRGDLYRQIFSQVNNNELAVGTDRIYGALMHYGAAQGQFGKSPKKNLDLPFGDIPARNWLGIGKNDEEEIYLIIQDHLTANNQ